jgi:hypothetical protein
MSNKYEKIFFHAVKKPLTLPGDFNTITNDQIVWYGKHIVQQLMCELYDHQLWTPEIGEFVKEEYDV